jgi:hypothetical protein
MPVPLFGRSLLARSTINWQSGNWSTCISSRRGGLVDLGKAGGEEMEYPAEREDAMAKRVRNFMLSLD